MVGSVQPAWIAAAILGGYLIGSIPFGVIATRLGGVGDIRKIGSGNIGATNVLRAGRKDLAFITLIGDMAKGAAAVLLARAIAGSDAGAQALMGALAGGAAFIGHLFPVWLRFRGGKGVATFLGVMFAAAWPAGLACAATWLLIAALFRISSLAALAAAAMAPVYVFYLDAGGYPTQLLALGMAALVFVRHHENIRRLLRNEEPRIGQRKTGPAA